MAIRRFWEPKSATPVTACVNGWWSSSVTEPLSVRSVLGQTAVHVFLSQHASTCKTSRKAAQEEASKGEVRTITCAGEEGRDELFDALVGAHAMASCAALRIHAERLRLSLLRAVSKPVNSSTRHILFRVSRDFPLSVKRHPRWKSILPRLRPSNTCGNENH